MTKVARAFQEQAATIARLEREKEWRLRRSPVWRAKKRKAREFRKRVGMGFSWEGIR